MPATRQGILSIIGKTEGIVAPLRCHRKNPGRSAEGKVKKRAIQEEGAHKITWIHWR